MPDPTPQPYITLSQFLKRANIVQTGGEGKLLIQSGEVLVNGEVETRRKRKLVQGDRVTLGEDVLIVPELRSPSV
jgi:ribosome-associated protein